MAQISQTRGAPVGKEEALRMEEEALARLQRDKRQTHPTTALTSSRLAQKPARSNTVPQTRPQTDLSLARPEKDLIVFPETKKPAQEPFKGIDVDKLTNEELEKLLLDDNFAANRPSKPSLLGFNLSASYPGGANAGHAYSGGAPWSHMTNSPSPLFPTAPFPKTFQNGFPPFMATPFVPFTPPSATAAMVFPSPPPQPKVDPEMAKLFDKIASTKEYLKNGKAAGSETDSASSAAAAQVTSLEPNNANANANTLESAANANMGRFEWLDLDPLTKRRSEAEEAELTEARPCEGDPWDAVLKTEDCGSLGDKSLDSEVRSSGRSQRRTNTGVTRSHSLNIHDAKSTQEKGRGKVLVKNTALDQSDAQNLELLSFCRHVQKLRCRFSHSDASSNPGFVLSPVIAQRNADSNAVKVCIEVSESGPPVTFTCDVSSPVELLISQTLCWVHDDLDKVDFSKHLLKVCGQEEVLQNKHSLGSHEYIQSCRKWESDIRLQLLNTDSVRRDLARTAEDDVAKIDLDKHLTQVERPYKENVTRQGLADYLEGYHRQVALCLQDQSTQYKSVVRLVQTVKNLCCALDEVETSILTDAVKRLQHQANLPRTRSPKLGSSAHSTNDSSPVEDGLSVLTEAVYDLVKLYLRSFCGPSHTGPAPRKSSDGGTSPDHEGAPDLSDDEDSLGCGSSDHHMEASGVTEHLQLTLSTLHGLPHSWVSSYEKYFVMCALTHNGKNLFKPVQSKRVGTYRSFFYHVRWDELISFPMAVALLPLEASLSITLFAVQNQSSSGSPDTNRARSPPEQLGKVTVPLFDFRRVLVSGSCLLGLWTCSQGPGANNRAPNERIVLQLDFPSRPVEVLYVKPKEAPAPDLQSLEELDPDLKRKLERVCGRASNYGLKRSDLGLLWDQRLHCLKHHPQSLPKVLSSAPCWDWASLPQIHSVLFHWPQLPPVTALELLDSRFSDSDVRTVAVSWIEQSSDDELSDYLPQLVQALKFENHLKNALVMLLLSRALGNIRIAHYLYWLLKDAVQDSGWGWRYERVLGALLCLCGASLRAQLEKQSRLVTLLGAVAERVKAASGASRQVALQEGLENVQNLFEKSSCRLPLCPSLQAKELNLKACSFFNSNAVPLKLALVNADPLGQEISVMFKVGEDLRQDMLALQMIRIMDRIWLQDGLDLRIVHFKCISTGKDKGMVELVACSETLRKIQVEYGVTGSFKDKPLAEWLRKYNPAEDEYDKASENFIYSCAGCCVATYVLGICDRHNDNIMLRSTGHMFHIDFGKFLGHAQMFGSFKRDRAPFVLTSDMAYVINGGEKPTSRFQLFVDLCCQAYNVIRKNSSLFLNLLSLMTGSGLPELTGAHDLKYVFDALQPNNTDAEATIFFTRLIESSLGSVATKFNFFIHNLAQLRFSGLAANDDPILTFSPKTYSMKQDGRILQAAIFSFQKRYSPDKHYTYAVRILREGQTEPQFVFRTFDEFQELHTKLSVIFQLWKLPSFPNKMVLGRTHIKEVALKRKLELNNYVHNLLRSSAEVTQCDLIYTFFHPIARDDKTDGESVLKAPEPPPSPVSGRVEGEVKVSISYRNSTLFIMIMHIRDLVAEEGSDPNPYVKTYLLPDPNKTSKRKTKILRKTRNPTFNEMLVYNGHSKESLGQRELQLSVLSAESLRENYFLGGVTLRLHDFDLSKETVRWYKLTDVPLF